MSLSPGTSIGSYEILASIGAGGMGEVYRARDAKLGREVALKVLPDVFAGDPDRLARFEREARTLASLNHPNIAHVYDAGKDAAGAFLVMELVEGEDLSAHIARGPMPPSEVLLIAKQIADALEAAHESGIVHRDLKPANIKLRSDGTVKVLDFGLAKAMDSGTDGPASGGSRSTPSNSPTLTARATQMGMIIGTAAYMAPEQARGRPVDRRADIWAFGVVLYEMLTGRRAFDGDDISITLASVLKEDVDWTALPADLPQAWQRLLRRCLEKDPRRRLSAIADARLELDEAANPNAVDASLTSGGGAAAATAAHLADTARLQRKQRMALIVAGVATVAFAATLVAWAWPRPSRPEPQRVQFSLPTSAAATAGQLALSISPDGRWLTYSGPSSTGGPNTLWVRPLDGLEARALPGTEQPAGPFWSQDSENIGYVSGSALYRVSASGGAPQRLADATGFAGGTWMPSGEILFAVNSGGNARLYRISDQGGGTPVEVPQPNAEGPASSITYPVMLPDGRHFLYLGWTVDSAARGLFIGALDGTAPIRVTAADGAGVYAMGHLLFPRAGTLFAQRIDLSSFTVSGDPVRLADGVLGNALTGRAAYSASANGLLAYRTGTSAANASDITWFDRGGRQLDTVGSATNLYQIRLSPDARRVAVVDSAPGATAWRISVLDLSNGVSSRLTDEALLSNDPVWSPDSQSVTFGAVRDGVRQIFTQQVGASTASIAYESPEDPKWLDDLSPDGTFLLFHRPRPSKLYAVTPGEPQSLKLLLDTTETVDGAHFSPDGKWIGYQLTESGTPQVWIASFPAFDQRRQISPLGGGQALWRGDGKELFYLTPGGKLMAARVDRLASGALEVAAPTELFQSPLTQAQMGIDQYSVSKDGQRFLFIKPRVSSTATQAITVVVNWNAGTRSKN